MIERLNAALSDRYALERELGEGGMATVYLAEDLKHHRKVALKVLKPELAAVVGGERFLTEIETTARLQHPNILPLFDSGEADTFLFYVMPYVEGETLRDRLERERQLPVDEAVRIATEVAEALQAAHEHGVVHRDIKPANIMVSKGRPVVADFGIALALSSAGGHRLTETGLSVGTPHYMSPEQATGDQVVGPPSDVYSLGCVLYEMLAGEPPYTGGTAQAILGKVITTDPQPVTAHRRAVPPHVASVVSRALEKVPADRFASAADFAKALGDEAFRHGVAAAGSGASAGPLRWLAAAGWASAVILGTLWMTSAFDPPDPPQVRTLSLAVAAQDGPSEWFGLTPDGSALVISDARTWPNRTLSVRRLDDLVRTPILGSEGAVDPVVSPDGALVAWGSPDGLFVAPLAGGTRRTLVPAGSACCLRWGDDGAVYYMSEGSIYRVRAAGGEPELVLEAPPAGDDHAYYHPLAGGSKGLYTRLDGRVIEMVDVASGERREITEGVRPVVVGGEYLVFGRGGETGTILAAPLDVGAMTLAGSPVLMVENVGTGGGFREVYFTVSESGDLVYWTPGGDVYDELEMIWVDRAGQVTPLDTAWTKQIESVELSPDGARAAVTVSVEGIAVTEIWIKELDGGPARRLTNYRGMNRRAVWSPDGTSLAFISDRGGSRAAWVVPVDQIGTPELLLEHPGADVDEVFWSRGGDWLVYRTGTTTSFRDVYARRLGPDSTTLVVSAQPGVDERSPVLSPDGRWVAYVSNETGQVEVWMRPFPDVGRGARQVSFGAGLVPVWSERGDELFFRGPAGFTSVSIEGGETLTVGGPRVLFPNELSDYNSIYRSYAYDPRGDRFLMTRPFRAVETTAELILVENFMDEVKARLGG